MITEPLNNLSYDVEPDFSKFSSLTEARKRLGSKGIRDLLHKAFAVAKDFHLKEAELVQVLKEVDDTKAYRLSGYNSLFRFCIEGLGLSEHQAYSSITVARKLKEIPELLEPLKNGQITLSKIRRMASVINAQNKEKWIKLAESLSQKELEKAVRGVDPRPPVLDHMQILSDDEVKIQGTLSNETSEKLLRVLELLREQKNGSVTYDEALNQLCDLYLDKHDPLRRAERVLRKKAKSEQDLNRVMPMPTVSSEENLQDDSQPEPVPEEIQTTKACDNDSENFSNSAFAQLWDKKRKPLPAKLKHQVWLRDQGQCRLHRHGQRCAQRVYLQIHHKVPLSQGGRDELENLVLLCTDHHQSLHEV